MEAVLRHFVERIPKSERMPKKRPIGRATKDRLAKGIPFIPILSFIGGTAFSAFTIAKNIATVPYVDSKFDRSIQYTDQKANEILEKAISHSDLNRAIMEKSLEVQTGLIKEQSAILTQVKDWLQRLSDRVSTIADNTQRKK